MDLDEEDGEIVTWGEKWSPSAVSLHTKVPFSQHLRGNRLDRVSFSRGAILHVPRSPRELKHIIMFNL